MWRLRPLSVAILVLILLATFPASSALADAKVRVRSFIPKTLNTVPVGSFTVFNVTTQVFVEGTITGAVVRAGYSCELAVTNFSASQGMVSVEPVGQELEYCTRLTWVIGTLSGVGGDTPVATMQVELTTNSGELAPAGEHTIKRQGRLNYDEGSNAFTVHDNEIVVTAE